jgi:hypothetical protein
MEISEAENVIFEVANYEDWSVLSLERRAALNLRTEPRPAGQLRWLLEDIDGDEAEDAII